MYFSSVACPPLWLTGSLFVKYIPRVSPFFVMNSSLFPYWLCCALYIAVNSFWLGNMLRLQTWPRNLLWKIVFIFLLRRSHYVVMPGWPGTCCVYRLGLNWRDTCLCPEYWVLLWNGMKVLLPLCCMCRGGLMNLDWQPPNRGSFKVGLVIVWRVGLWGSGEGWGVWSHGSLLVTLWLMLYLQELTVL